MCEVSRWSIGDEVMVFMSSTVHEGWYTVKGVRGESDDVSKYEGV